MTSIVSMTSTISTVISETISEESIWISESEAMKNAYSLKDLICNSIEDKNVYELSVWINNLSVKCKTSYIIDRIAETHSYDHAKELVLREIHGLDFAEFVPLCITLDFESRTRLFKKCLKCKWIDLANIMWQYTKLDVHECITSIFLFHKQLFWLMCSTMPDYMFSYEIYKIVYTMSMLKTNEFGRQYVSEEINFELNSYMYMCTDGNCKVHP